MPRRRQADAAHMALKQRHTNLPFERPDTRCHIGLNGMKFGSRPVHAAVTGHCLEHLEVGDIHAVYLDEIDKALTLSSQARTAQGAGRSSSYTKAGLRIAVTFTAMASGKLSTRLFGLEFLAIDATRYADVLARMLMQDHIDDLRVGADRVVRDLNDVSHQLLAARRRQSRRNMTFDKRHANTPAMFI
ncbi:hypothetical protein BCAR13_860009 [Paraburkholderia caribensis]|nr:hypothetical protein BCAR13_860009 [Paraburkholderia caribensis]